MPEQQHPLEASREGCGAHRQCGQARSPRAEGTGAGEEGQRKKRRADHCTTLAPHLVDKLPDVLLPQVVHHVLGSGEAVRRSPAQHTAISQKKPVFSLQTRCPAMPGFGPQAEWGQKGASSLEPPVTSDTDELETCPQLPLPWQPGPAHPKGAQTRSCPTRLPGQVVSVKEKSQSEDTDLKHLQPLLTAPPPRQHKRYCGGHSYPRPHHWAPAVMAQMCQALGLGHLGYCAATSRDTSPVI